MFFECEDVDKQNCESILKENIMAKKTVRKVTANKKILLNQLAELLCQFLPLSSNAKNAITFKS